MALGWSLSLADYGDGRLREGCNHDGGLEPTMCMRTMGRKRILIRNRSDVQAMDIRSDIRASKRPNLKANQSLRLDALPLDVLARIVCGVRHDDLKQLYLTSKTLKEAAMIAKTMHFAFSTPKMRQDRFKKPSVKTMHFAFSTPKMRQDRFKKPSVNRDSLDFHESDVLEEVETPNAPLRLDNKAKKRFGKKCADISVNLFRSII